MAEHQDNSTNLQLLIDQANEGQSESWSELLGIAIFRLQRLTRRMLKNYPSLRGWEQTDDIFQNAAMRLYDSLSEVKPDSVKGFFGLAVLQIRRTLIELARKYYGPQGIAANHESDSEGNAVERPRKTDSSKEPITLEEWTEFHESVAKLPEDIREVFELIWYGGLEQKVVASTLGISLSTVQRRFYRARCLLGESLRSNS